MYKKQFKYLLVLQQPSADSAQTAFELARSLNLRVASQIGDRAIEVLATPLQVKKLFIQGLFSHCTHRSISKEHLENLDPELTSIIQTWNARFSKAYLKLKKDKSKQGLKW